MSIDLANQTQLYLGLFEKETHRLFRLLAADMETGIDIGADQGEYSLYMASRTNASTVLAIEPGVAAETLLAQNLTLNGLGESSRIKTVKCYLGDGSDGTRMLDDLVDKSLAENKLPMFIKIDVDGAELAILRGAQRLIGAGQVRWLLETHSLDLERSCISTFKSAGYAVQVLPNARWRAVLPEKRTVEHNRWLVAVRQDDPLLAETRLGRDFGTS